MLAPQYSGQLVLPPVDPVFPAYTAAPALEPIVVEDDYRPGDYEDYPQVEYRYFRYSSFATPWLLLMLLWFVTLLCLTLWQGPISIKSMPNGIPRDLETRAKMADGDGGWSRQTRNLRIAAAILGIVPPLIALLLYYTGLKAKLTKGLLMVLAVILIVCTVVGIISFAVDVGNLGNLPQTCKTQTSLANRARYCQPREALGVAAVTLAFSTAVFAAVTAVMIIMWGKYFTKTAGATDLQVSIPGQSKVYSTLLGLGFFITLASASTLLVFTILIHELRERVNGSLWTNDQEYSGWSARNTSLRLTTCIVGTMLVVLSLLPYPHRVYAYVLAFLFLFVAPMFFVIFALDISELRDARNLSCPVGLSCIYHPYNTVIVFDIIAGLLVLIYLIVQFLVKKSRSYVVARQYNRADNLDDYDFGAGAFLGGPSSTLAERKLVEAPAPHKTPRQRPLVGIEVVEREHPTTGELILVVLNVTHGGAADLAGIRVGDYIAKWNDMQITTKADFAAALSDSQIGSTVIIQVVRQAPGGFGSHIEYCRLFIQGAH